MLYIPIDPVCLREGDQINVCKQAFCQIHAIGKDRVEILCKKVVSGVLFSGDNHGKHKNRSHAICNKLKTQVRGTHYFFSLSGEPLLVT